MPRRLVVVRGIVQGVGFRPFVYHLARTHRLAGFVRNDTGGVHIEVEGAEAALEAFVRDLSGQPPPLARIDSLHWEGRPETGEDSFRIVVSEATPTGPVLIGADIATCPDCLRELLDPADRRFGYPFLNCTNCGPRLTIIRGAPYDRERTTMAAFALCAACRAEYDDPADRRFHAQPTACAACGPRLELRGLTPPARPVSGEPGGDCLSPSLGTPSPPTPLPLWGRGETDRPPAPPVHGEPGASAPGGPLRAAVELLCRGGILALKGLGGFHLVCDARNEEAVNTLRQRKQRYEKPFALMVEDISDVQKLCSLSDEDAALLRSPRRPIVLLRRRPDAGVAGEVAPGNPWLGVMLPYTPLHHLLVRELPGVPLVMTSGNRSDEPIAFRDADALRRLHGIADAFLTHDRDIHLRCDDSVTRIVAGVELPVRRSRGDAPQPVLLPRPCDRPVLALGGQQKVTFALGRGPHALLSHHVGDLDDLRAYEAYTEAIRHYEDLFDLRPEVLAHDLHPDYASTRYAHERARREGVRLVGVQHHHAHLASCLADNGASGPALGVIFDGTGYGLDGTVWGGEFLVGDRTSFRRAAHLRTVPMPGGEQAIRQPWRMALAHLVDAGEGAGLLAPHVPAERLRMVEQLVARAAPGGSFAAPLTSSAGRLFDAVAALAGLRAEVSYEGQAAVELEAAALGAKPQAAEREDIYPFPIVERTPPGTPHLLDTRPLVRGVAADVRAGLTQERIARRFHLSLAEGILAMVRFLSTETGLSCVALSGGVFLNVFLTEAVVRRLTAGGYTVYRHQQVPPNDGGLSLGQLAITSAQL